MAQAKQAQAPVTPEEVVNTVVDEGAHVGPRRFFTVPGRDPFEEIDWELRDALIPGKGGPAFEQRNVEFPKFWSQTATNIVAQKYFRGRMTSPDRERSVKQMIGRVVDTIGGWGRQGGYFATDEEADTFEAELKALLVNQYVAFNSPVWFNVGFEERPQCSACQPWHALVSTPVGMIPIGQLFEEDAVGREVYDANGTTRIVATKANGLKEVFRVTLRNGSFVEATADHVVKAVSTRRTTPSWLRVDELRVGMRMHLHPHRAKVTDRALAGVGGGTALLDNPDPVDAVAVAEAALAGWLQADGFVGQYEHGTNRSLTIEFQVANDDEYAWVVENLDLVFPDVHRNVRDVPTKDPLLSCRRIRLYGEELRDFVDRWQLERRGTTMRAPEQLWTASRDEIAAYLRSVFQADGYVSLRRDNGNENARIGFAVIAERWAEDVQLLLGTLGIYSRRGCKEERRDNRHDLHEVTISIGSERARFAELVGFAGTDKQRTLMRSLELRNPKTCPDLREEEIVSIESLGVMDVYDIQTESGEYLSNNVAVHNCFILSIEDSMESILDWIRREGIIFRGGSGSGLNLSKLRSSREQLTKGGYASGPVSFMRGADASAGTIKSGGKTRRAAKMVVLDVDHPDVDEFIWCKAREERKARVLEQAGYDMTLDSPDWASIQYQNANNSVRVTDAFMEAAVDGREWNLTARTDGTVIETVDARDLLRDIAAAAWECADPGVQYDTTINAWHTLPNTGRINASNPCSEYMSIDDSACNLASLNLMKFRKEDGELDVEAFEHAVDVIFLAQEIAVGYSSYPTPEIGRNAVAYRQLGLGYANLGALLMARGLPYDSDEGRAYAAAITALMTGRAYRKSAEVAKRMGPFAGYQPNAAAMLGVIAKHRAAVGNINHADSVPKDLLTAARNSWDNALEIGEVNGFRNSQATVLAPTGTISFMMDCDTTGVEPDFSLVKSKKLVGGGEITIVNKTVPMALSELGYAPRETEEVVAFIDERNTVVGAPHLKTDHYPVFDCAIGERAIHYMGHVKMMGAVQPFISGAISKCVVGETLVATEDGLVRIGSLHEGEREDSFRAMRLRLASLDGTRETDAFYFGGTRDTVEITLRSGHRVVGTPNHRVLTALLEGGLDWKRLDELEPGDQVATQYGDDLWSKSPAHFGSFVPSTPYGSQKKIGIPTEMSEELAFFLGAYVAEGHIARSIHTVRIANTDEGVIDQLVRSAYELFGINARVARQAGKCPSVELSSKTLVEFLDYLGTGDRSQTKRIPDAVLRSPRPMVLAFLGGLSLDSYIPSSLPKWAICVASNGLLDDLQAVLTNLGIVHSRVTKHNAEYDRSFDEVYASGRYAQQFVSMLRFPEPHKAARAQELAASSLAQGTADVVPGLDGRQLYELIPAGRSGRYGKGTGKANKFRHLLDPRTKWVSRESLERVATVPDVAIEGWLGTVLERNLHFSPVTCVRDGGEREVFDVSVPETHAFVANGIVNHNTVNLPEQTTVDEVSQLLVESWRLGVKAIAIYRDNCKVAQPLSGSGSTGGATAPTLLPPATHALPQRRRVPEDRTEVGRKFRVGDYEGYIHVGLFEDGTPGDIFVDIAKDGTTLQGLMNSLMISVSMGLQYGVPPEVYVSKLSHMRFEPSGLTNDADIRTAKSIVDYIFRWFGKKFLTAEQQEEAGILTPEVKARLAAAYAAGESSPSLTPGEAAPPGQTALFNQWEDAVECSRCGGRMVRTGSCYTCRDCGTNTGCS
jgi:ribonucleoside-diphosphate reductase alpha chain